MRAEDGRAELLRGAGIVLFGNLTGRALGFLYHVLLARFLGPRDYGVFLLGLAIFSFAALLGDLGLRAGVLRDAALAFGREDRAAARATILGGGKIALGASLLGSLSLLAITPWLADLFKAAELRWVLPIFAGALPFVTVGAVLLGALQALRQMVALSAVQFLLDPLLRSVVFVGLVIVGWSLLGAVVSHLVTSVVAALAAFLWLYGVFPSLPPGSSGPFQPRLLLSYALPLLLVNFVGFVLQWVDTLLLGYYLAAREVGLYGAAGRLAGLAGIFLAAASTIFAPKIFALYGQRDLAEVGRLYQHATRWVLIFAVPIFLFTVVHAESLLALFGGEFVAAAPALLILATAILVMTATGPAGDVVLMTGRSRVILWVAGAFGLMGVSLNAYLIPRLGLPGAALASGLTLASSNVTNVFLGWHYAGLQPYHRAMVRPVLLACAVAGIEAVVVLLIGGGPIARLATGASVWLLYPVLLWRLALRADDLEVWRLIKGTKGCAGSSEG